MQYVITAVWINPLEWVLNNYNHKCKNYNWHFFLQNMIKFTYFVSNSIRFVSSGWSFSSAYTEKEQRIIGKGKAEVKKTTG